METPKVVELDRAALSTLIDRIESAIANDLALSVEDMKLLLSAITTLCTLQAKMEQDDITLHKLRKLLGMVKQSERRAKAGSSGKGQNKNKRKGSQKKSRKKKPAAPVTVEHHKITRYQKGDSCPDCQRGKLYKFEPVTLLRITGHARYEAVEHVVEQLRCNGCQQKFKADLPAAVLADGDVNQHYGYSARSLMVIDKFFSGTPYYHQSTLADIFGHAISASTIFDQCEYVANDVMPVFYALKRKAADAVAFELDDTRNRILSAQPELRDKPNGKGKRLRTGIYTSGLIATCEDSHEIVLFETSLGHAGEHLGDILKARSPGLPPPLTMSDALSSNTVTQHEVKVAYCNAHARRQFFDLEAAYPKDIAWVLDNYAIIWKNDAFIEAQGMSATARLGYHEEHSLPVMETLREWALKRQASKAFEEHSPMGKAILYFLKHYERITLFCREPGARIDNNRMEEKLKIVIRGRKTAHFYKTEVGAGVANVLISLLATTYHAGENIFEYLQALQKNKTAVKDNPSDWLPWNYQQTLDALEIFDQTLKPDKAA